MDILGTTPSFTFYISIRNDPLNQFLKLKRLEASLTVNTILPQNLVSFRPVVPYQIVTSLISRSRLLPPSHVATKWIPPATILITVLFKVSEQRWQGHKKSSDFLTNPGMFQIFRGSHLERCRKQEEFSSQDEGNRG